MPIQLLFGRTRWARRRGVGALLRGERDVAYVMGTWRKREQLVRELAAAPTGEERLREPAAWVWGALLEELVRRFVDDRAALSPTTAAAVTQRWLATLRDPTVGDDLATAAVLHDTAEAYAGAGVVPDDPRLRSLVLGQRRVVDAVPGHRRATERLRLLHQALAAPSGALARWLGRHRAVVVDDLCGTTPLESAVFTALCAAWSEAGARVVCSFASGRDRGGREVAWALGVEPPEDREPAVFAATRALRSQVFEDLVASGLAEVFSAGPLGVREIDLVDADGPGAPPDLADAAAAGTPLPALPPRGGLTIGAHADPEAEAQWVARSLASLLRDGLDPRDALLAVGDPATEPTLLRALDDHDVPWVRGGGRPVGPVPAVRAARSLLGLPLESWPLDELLDAAQVAGVVSPSTGPKLRSAGVRGGDPASWEGPVRQWAVRARVDVAPLLAECEAVGALVAGWPPTDDAPADEWGRRLRGAWAALGARSPHLAAVDEALLGVVAALDAGGGEWTAPQVRAVVDRALLELTEEAPGGHAAVPVVGVREMLGLTPRHVFVVGLRAGAWAATPSSGPWAPERGVGREPVAVARYLLHALLRDAVGDPWMRGVHLSWPAAVDGRPQRPAPLLAEVAHLRVGDRALTELLAPGPAPAVPERPTDPHATAALVAQARRGPLGPHDGLLLHPVTSTGSVPVTTLETYLRCPHRYWVRHELGLDVLPADDPELEPRRRGTALHRILELFLRERDLRVAGDDARAHLAAVAGRVLDEVEAEGGFDPLFHAWSRSRWLAGLTDERPAGLLRAWLDSEQRRVDQEVVGVERPFRDVVVGPLTLRGVVDRVDRVGTAHLVVDYKTGRPPTRADVVSGLSLQPFAYLAAVPTPAAACFQVLTRPDRLARATFVGDEAALDRACTPSERRSARVVDADGRRAVLDEAGRRAEALLRGEFPPTPWAPEVAGCDTCPYRAECRRELRHTAL